MQNLVIISTTCDKKEDARRLADLLVSQRMVACAQIIGPITSVYRWEGEVTSCEEYKLEVKTLNTLSTAVCNQLIAEHPYQLPEIVGRELHMVSDGYLNWVAAEVNHG